ncbi:uncharacterized protein A4U43_C05F7730 [Asparagus officinalis]|uniref:Uncharacterized protein n=1 Tax=Asparagus officinalis TaxID=4686 RepID=A0A5P1ESN8_ASPOF|nr:uncharacterized protein A4U43_C05F7730 [Asparagus officinalis]
MEWRKCYLDLLLIPLSLLFPILYHCWLWHTVRTQPHRTIMGINSSGRRLWVLAIMKDNEKKNILAVQTVRNTLMGSTLMATTSILLSSNVISSTYSVKKPLADSVFGAHGEFMVALKYVVLLLLFLLAFLSYSLSIRFINQVNFLINVARPSIDGEDCDTLSLVTPEYVMDLLEKGWRVGDSVARN